MPYAETDDQTRLFLAAAAYAMTDFRADLASLKVPTLIIHGDLDASAPIDLTGRRTAALIAGSRLLVSEGSGHGLYAADHARLNPGVLASSGRSEPSPPERTRPRNLG
jgi:non-heme chloroperoxidase